MSETSPKTSLYDSPFRLLGIIAASEFVSDALVIVILGILPPVPPVVGALLDATLLTIFIYPILYCFMLRPMTQHLNERRQAEAALRQVQDDLELRVQQRTIELAEANESLQIQIVERQRASEELKEALDLVRQQRTEMAGLLAGARAVLEYRDFTDVVQAIFEACRNTIGAAAGYVALPTEDRSGERPVSSVWREGSSDRAAAESMPMMGLRQQAYVTRQTVFSNDCDTGEDIQWLPTGHLPIQNILFAPMTIKGFVVGTISLVNKPMGFSSDDARLASAFAEVAAIALLNSQTVELLESSERRFRTLAQATFEGIIISEDEIIREANEQFAQIYGLHLSAVIGKPVTDFLVPQGPTELVAAGDENQIGEYRASRRDGSLILLEARGRMIERSGRPLRVIAIRDITERKQAEEALRQNEENFSKAFRSNPAALLITRLADGQFLATNDAYSAIVGYDQAELLGRRTTDFNIYINSSDRQAVVERLLASGSIRDFEMSIRHRSGAIRHVVAAQELITFNGEDCIMSSLLDITERKYAEQALRENEEWLRLAFDAGDLGRWRFNVAAGTIHFDARARIHIAASENVISQAEALMHVHSDDRALLQQEVANALNPAGKGRYAAEYRVCWPDGDIHWLAVQARVHFEGEGAERHPVQAVGISQDITARKQAEQALWESQERLTFALKKSHTGGWDLDLVDHTTFRTLEHDRIFGYASLLPEWTYEMFLDHVIPEDRAEVDRLFQKATATQTDWNFECRIRRADGEVRWIWAVGGHQFDDTGQARRMAGIMQDITERKRVEKALRESEERFRLALKNAPVSIAAQDLDLRFRWAYNQRTMDPSSVIGKTDNDLFAPEDAMRLITLKRAVIESNTERREQLWLTSGGQRVFLDLYLEPMRDAAGQVTGIGIATVDLTQMKLTEEALRMSQIDFDRAQEVGQIGSWRIDVRSNSLTWSDENHRIFGIPKGTPLTYDTFLETVHPEDREQVDGKWKASLVGEPYDIEHRILVGDSAKWVREKAFLEFDKDGMVRGAFGITQDITARKQAEERVIWLASFPEINPNPVVEVDLDGTVHYLNPTAKRLMPDLVTEGQAHPWLADLEALGRTFQADNTTVITREIVLGTAIYQQTMSCVPNTQRVRIYFLDITARKRAEEQLRLLSTTLEAAVNGVAVTDRQGQILWVNPAFSGLTGYSREEVLGQNPRVLKSGQHDAEFYKNMWATILGGHPWRGEIVNRRKDGALYYEKMTITPVRANGGDSDITHFVAIKEDITARKQADEALERQAALIDLSPVAIIVRRPDGTITFWSQGAETLYGWREHEALGRQVADLIQSQLPISQADILDQLQHTGHWTGEIIQRTRRGLQIIVQGWWLAQFNAQGEITEIFESNVDFTVRKQMEEELRLAQAGLELRVLERTAELAAANNELRLQSAALQAAANGIVITDPAGNIQWANSAFASMTGYALPEVASQNMRVLKSDGQIPEFYHQMWETILLGQVWQGELTNRRKDGSLYVEEQTISPVLNESGQIVNFIAIKQDITERKQAEERLRQYNRDLLTLGNSERRARQIAETLAAASLALTQSLELEAVMETLLDYMIQLVPYDSANVMLLEAEDRLVVRAIRGYEEWTQAHLTRDIAFDARSNPILHDLLFRQKSVLIPATEEHPHWEVRPGAEHVRSWIGVPIIAGNRVIGIYSLDKVDSGYFTSEHVQLAESLVGQAAVAIQNAWLFDQLRAGRERLQSLSRRLVEVQEAERHYVARELHDEAGQALTSLVYGLGELEHETVPERRALRLAELKKATHEILENLHHLAMELRPASLDFLGLVPALNQYVKATGERYGLNAQFKVIGLAEERLPNDIETALYRIVQEALTNVVRHARATRVDVLLERRGEQVILVVEDNGHGFTADLAQQAQDGHLGLVGMQERAEMLNGTLVIESNPDSGTTIVIEVPYAHTNSHRG